MTASAKRTDKTVRAVASEILFKVDRNKAYADILLDETLRTNPFDDRDRALLTELIYGTLRWRGVIDARLIRLMRRPLAKADPFIRNLLRLTLYQIIFLDKIPAYAAVNEAVELAKLRGARAASFVNGVLRNFLRDDEKDGNPAPQDRIATALAEKLSHPEWLVARWLADFGVEEATSLMRANNDRAPLVVRVNSLKCGREELLARFREGGIDARPTHSSPQGISVVSGATVAALPGFAEGLFQVQGEASQLVTYLLGPQPGERVLDACAAPGGKSTHIAEMMRDSGNVIALDPSARGIDRIQENAARLQLRSVQAVRGDASRRLDGACDGPFERILVDAPCSGLGTLRSHPEIKWQRGQGDIRRLSQLQSKILANVAAHLKPGGVLVYSTCTLLKDENDGVVEGFLCKQGGFELEDVAGYLPEGTRYLTRHNYFQTLPHRDNMDGFFAARMRKVS
ncbi:MAG: 16S rRNA (cytosine(967)-C(5))-methyltransferase RsmB [Chloroflexota bacterium]